MQRYSATIYSNLIVQVLLETQKYYSPFFNFLTLEVNCGLLPNIPNGSVVLNGITFGSVATYSCIEGFVVMGIVTRTCGADEVWSGNEPSCPPIDTMHLVISYSSMCSLLCIKHTHYSYSYICCFSAVVHSVIFPFWSSSRHKSSIIYHFV